MPSRGTMCVHMMSVFLPVLAAAFLLSAPAADTASSRPVWNAADRMIGTQRNRTIPRTTVQPRQSLKPSPGEIKGLGSRFPAIRMAPGTPGHPKYYPRAMRPIEPE